MRILVNAISARRGGITTYTRNLIRSLADRNQDVQVAVAPQFHAEFPDRTFAVPAADFRQIGRFLWEQVVWREIVRRRRPDILFSSANFGLLASPVPQILLMREGGLFDPLYLTNIAPAQGLAPAIKRHLRRKAMLLSARRADHVMTPSRAMLDSLLAWAPDLADRCSVNPYGTLHDFYRPERSTRPWRQDGILRALYVSVYYPHKNPGLLCEAARHLNQAGLKTIARITMGLRDVEETAGSALDRILLKQGIAEGYVEAGQHRYDDLPDLYHHSDVFVFPSVSETFGHPMAEAMSSGLPVVAADTKVNREVCGDAALYFRPFSAKELTEQLLRLDRSPDLRSEMAMRGRQRVVGSFRWEDHVDRLMETFNRVVSSRRRE